MKNIGNEILKVENCSISFLQYEKGFHKIELPVIRDLNLTVHEKEIVAVIGASGSGKSLLAHGILGILPYNAKITGNLYYQKEELTNQRQKALRGHEIVLVPQSVSYLNPLMKIGPQLRKGSKDEKKKVRSKEILFHYGLDEEVEKQYPFQLSGGMARRVLISTAVMESPKLVIADEPTPGLHIEAAKRVMSHFRELADSGAGVLLITHDLELALETADRIVVFYAGTTVEDASAEDFNQEETLRHPYTKALYRAMPRNGFQFIEGSQPYVKDIPQGCPFSPRCSKFTDKCLGEIPYQEINNGFVKCIYGINDFTEEHVHDFGR